MDSPDGGTALAVDEVFASLLTCPLFACSGFQCCLGLLAGGAEDVGGLAGLVIRFFPEVIEVCGSRLVLVLGCIEDASCNAGFHRTKAVFSFGGLVLECGYLRINPGFYLGTLRFPDPVRGGEHILRLFPDGRFDLF